jgi:ribonuclease P protein component
LAKQFTLGREERLKSRKQIEQLFKEGKSFAQSPYRIFYQFTRVETGALLKAGVGVSNRNFKKAVDRNRVKRLTREAWRLQKNSLNAALEEKKLALAVFLIFTGKELPQTNFVKEKIAIAINKLLKLVNENNSPAA